jgi:hypothetical protein
MLNYHWKNEDIHGEKAAYQLEKQRMCGHFVGKMHHL